MKLFHVSENDRIGIFQPRSSPSEFPNLKGDIVFAISDKLLHNYLLPRECPRVTYYRNKKTFGRDISKYFGDSPADYIINIEEKWIPEIEKTTLYCYELPDASFYLLDAVAGYYISYLPVLPISITRIDNLMQVLRSRMNIELRILKEIHTLAVAVTQSSLNYSLIRMRNAQY